MPSRNHNLIRRMNPASLSPALGYSHVVIVPCGRTVYVASQVPLDTNGELVDSGDFEAQVRQTFENLKSALVAGSATFADIVSMNIYVTDARVVGKYVQVRSEYMPHVLPAAILVKSLFRPDVMIEISAIAVTPSARNTPIRHLSVGRHLRQ
jgi:enamine deaminase RidA (YjgF/YER057c/UK114 family)